MAPDELHAPPDIIVHRSKKRKKTIQAKIKDGSIHVYLPAHLTQKEEDEWVRTMTKRVQDKYRKHHLNNDIDLFARSQELNRAYFQGKLNYSIQFVTNQQQRYGSCSPHNNTIRISDRIATMPRWVQDYVILHELAHLLIPNHSQDFWDLVNQYRYTERARGYLIAKGLEEEES